jgi:hypothetical protein
MPRNRQRKPKPVKPVVLANNVSPRPVQNQTKARKPPRQRTARKGGVQAKHVKPVCTITDPFCPAARNAKWPDGTGGNTFTQQFRGNSSLATGAANGNNAFCFAAAAPFGYLTASSTTATTVSMTPAYLTYQASSLLATFGGNYRIVSFGVIIRCVASATNASGLVTLGTGSAVPVSSVLTLGTELYDEVIVKAIQPGLELSWISAPRGTGARDFIAQSTSTLTTANTDWTCLTVELSGCPNSTTMLQAEWFLNIEFQMLAGNQSLSALSRPNPPKSDHATTASSTVTASIGSFIEGGIKDVENIVATHAKAAVQSFLDDPLESLAALFA